MWATTNILLVYNTSFTPLFAALVGGALSIVGGFAAQVIRARIDKRDRLSYIKIGLSDELTEIRDILKSLKDTHVKSKLVYQIDLDSLASSMGAFEHHRQFLYLINDAEIRKKISNFYKSLRNEIEKCRDIVTTITPSATVTNQFDKSVSEFYSLHNEAGKIQQDVNNYSYRVWTFRNK